MDVTTVCGKEFLLLSEVGTVRSDYALRIEHKDILTASSESHIELCTHDSGCASSTYHNLHVLNLLLSYFEGIDKSGRRDDGSAMLVIVHHWDVERFLQTFLDIETLWSLDIFKVDTTEGRSNLLYSFAEFLWVFLINLNIEYIDATVNLEEQSLTFHYRLAGHCAYIAESEHGSTIGYYCDKVSLVCVFIYCIGIFLNFQTWECYTW